MRRQRPLTIGTRYHIYTTASLHGLRCRCCCQLSPTMIVSFSPCQSPDSRFPPRTALLDMRPWPMLFPGLKFVTLHPFYSFSLCSIFLGDSIVPVLYLSLFLSLALTGPPPRSSGYVTASFAACTMILFLSALLSLPMGLSSSVVALHVLRCPLVSPRFSDTRRWLMLVPAGH